MATLVTAVLPASDAQLQFQGPFISTAVNRKTTGIIPAGIFRGFSVTALGPIVTINADGGTGDSVAVCNTINASLVENYYNVTVRHSGNINMDFSSAASPTVIVLEARYDLTSPTPVEGLTEVRIKAISAIDVMPYHVVLATATAGPNPLIDLSTADVTGGPLPTSSQVTTTTSPLSQVLGFATFAGSIGNTGGPVVDIPTIPATVSFTLSVAKTVLVLGSANSVTVGEDTSAAFMFSIDAVDTPGASSGFGLNGANGLMIPSMSFMVPLALAAGPHVIKARWAGLDAGQGCSLNGPTHITVIG